MRHELARRSRLGVARSVAARRAWAWRSRCAQAGLAKAGWDAAAKVAFGAVGLGRIWQGGQGAARHEVLRRGLFWRARSGFLWQVRARRYKVRLDRARRPRYGVARLGMARLAVPGSTWFVPTRFAPARRGGVANVAPPLPNSSTVPTRSGCRPTMPSVRSPRGQTAAIRPHRQG